MVAKGAAIIDGREKQRLALEEALCLLPLKKVKGPGLPYETLIPAMARELLRLKGNQGRKTFPPKDGLRRVEKEANRLVKVLNKLHPNAIEALDGHALSLGALKIVLKQLEFAAVTVEVNGGRGAPRKVEAQKIKDFLAECFESLTGGSGTDKSKRFVTLLGRLYGT